MLQKTFLLVCLFLFTAGIASAQQPTANEIRKLKIKKISWAEEGGSSKTEIYYDANGNDTAQYAYGIKSYYKTIEYDAKQCINSIKQFSAEGEETENTIYTYKPDGSFTTVNKDKKYGLVNKETYNKKGQIVSHTVPDGSIRHYEYNTKEQLVKLYSEPKNDGVKFTNTYTYNKAGKLVSQQNTGEYPATYKYEYDNKGLLKKLTVKTGNEEEGVVKTVYICEYF
jgi:YD repeat-containing protein